MAKTSATISVKDMLPGITDEQIKALQAGQPCPPGPGWTPPSQPTASDGPILMSTPKDGPNPLEQAFKAAIATVEPSAVVSLVEPPLVTAIMVFSESRRMRRARSAVNQFMNQQYSRKQLVIVNTTEHPITNVPHFSIHEISIPGQALTLGEMRNIAIDNGRGDWFMQWDDDDYYHPLRMAYQMAHRTPGRAQLLTQQLRCQVIHGSAYMHVQPEGIPNTILFPRSNARYQHIQKGEDVEFWKQHWAFDTLLLYNSTFPADVMSIAIHDGHNVLDEDEFMVGHASPEFHGRWQLGDVEADHLRAVLKTFGFDVQQIPVVEEAVG